MSASRKRVCLLAFAILLAGAGAERFVALNVNPPGLNQDEASVAVDAYWLGKTGRDRAGALWPLAARSFGDYPPALYRYLSIPWVAAFGLEPWTARMTAAFFGTLLVGLTGLLVWGRLGFLTGFCCMAVVALCPTAVHFSRFGADPILLPTLSVLVVLLMEHVQRVGAVRLLWFAAGALLLALISYQAAKLWVPLLGVLLLVSYWPTLIDVWHRRRRHLLGPVILFLAAAVPIFAHGLGSEGMARARDVAAWSHHSDWDLVKTVFSNYLAYFDPVFLFLRGYGGNMQIQIQESGHFNTLELPFLVIGLVVAVRHVGEHSRFLKMVVAWFLLGPLPGAFAAEMQNPGRVGGWLPAPQILAGIGVAAVLAWCWRHRAQAGWARTSLRRALAVVVCALWVATAVSVTYATHVVYPRATAGDWHAHTFQALRCARAHRVDERIVVSPDFYEPEVFAHFHFATLAPRDEPVWTLGKRERIGAGEIYAAPANAKRPAGGRLLCDIHTSGGELKAFVYGPSK